MATTEVVFFTYRGGTYEADLLAGTYWPLPNPATLTDRRTVLTRAGVSWTNWTNAAGSMEVTNPAAFGLNAALPTVDARALAALLAPLLHGLTDLDIERVRDAGVEALELTKGTLAGSTIRFSRAAQG